MNFHSNYVTVYTIVACLLSANRNICYCVARYENFAVNQKASIVVSYVIKKKKKKMVMLLAVRISSYGCTWEVWRALKKLELHSAIASCNSYASFVLSKLPKCIHNSIYAR